MSISTDPLAFVVSMNDDRGGMQLPIIGPSFSIGRDGSNNLCVMDDPAISRQHCVIHVVGSSLMIEDVSRNGTFLDGERVAGLIPLPIPSSVMVGHTSLSIIPNEPDEENVTSIIDTSLVAEGGLFIPQTSMLRVRTDAYLVVDVVDSTGLVKSEGQYFAKLVLAMGRTLEQFLKGEVDAFLKCTGDGYFACFGSAGAALKAGVQLVPTLTQQIPMKAQISVALHWGPSTLTEQRDRIGNHIHAVFSLEQVRHHEQTIKDELTQQKTNEVLVMTREFWEELDEEEQALARPIGSYPLKGFEDVHTVYRWFGSKS